MMLATGRSSATTIPVLEHLGITPGSWSAPHIAGAGLNATPISPSSQCVPSARRARDRSALEGLHDHPILSEGLDRRNGSRSRPAVRRPVGREAVDLVRLDAWMF
jgi:hypothetical protein